jgi:pantetheine-phosphate adenylyltransferase
MRALFPGSFDPVTPGHRDILRRAANLFDDVVACVMVNPNKTGRFTIDERLTLLTEAATGLANVTVDSHARLLVDYCHQAGIDVIIRGVRNVTDLQYELPMVHLNNQLAGIETLFVLADPAQVCLSSSVVKATQRTGSRG